MKFRQIVVPPACFAAAYAVAAWTAVSSRPAPPESVSRSPVIPAKFDRGSSAAAKAEPTTAGPAVLHPLASPRGVSFIRLVDELRQEDEHDWSRVGAAIRWWLGEDAVECLDNLPLPAELPSAAIGRIAEAIVTHGSRLESGELLDLATHPAVNGFADTQSRLLDLLAPQLWARGPEAVREVETRFDFSTRAAFLGAATRHCPDEHAHLWADQLVDNNHWHLLSRLPQIQADDGARWLDAWLENKPEGLASLARSVTPYQQLRYRGPIEGSLDALLDDLAATSNSAKSLEERRGIELERLVAARIAEARRELLESRPSPLLGFARGEINAEALLAAFPEGFGLLLDGAPEVTRQQLFPLLAAANPEEAVAWLDSLPAGDKHATILDSAGGLARDPKRLLGLFTAYPYDPRQGPLQSRFRKWMGSCRPAYEQYGDSYAQWLISLPTSVDRDMALGTLAHDLRSADPALAERLIAAKNFTPPGK